MTNACETVLDRLPDHVGGRLPRDEMAEIERHLDGCSDCRTEAELLQLLAVDRPAPPQGMEARIQAAVTRVLDGNAGPGDGEVAGALGDEAEAPPRAVRRAPRALPAWAWAAAAALALFLGIEFVANGGQAGGPQIDGPGEFVALNETEYSVVPQGDIVAGAPVLDGLTEDDLNQLLEEWDG